MSVLTILAVGFFVIYVTVCILVVALEMPQNSTLRATLAAYRYRWLAWLVLAAPVLTATLQPWEWVTLPPTLKANDIIDIALIFSVLITSAIASVWMSLPRKPEERINTWIPMMMALFFSLVMSVATSITLSAGR